MKRVLFCVVALFQACDCSPSPAVGGGNVGDACTTERPCLGDLLCAEGVCTAPSSLTDSGRDGAPDAALVCEVGRPCGGECCSTGETCGGSHCCLPTEMCGGVCCGDSETCEANRCVLDCGADRVQCGDSNALVCCGTGQLCYLGACINPGIECTSTRMCPDGQYCEPTAAHCLPRATGDVCEFRPPTRPLEVTLEWEWTSDADVVPMSNQVMMTPMVANLTDDNADGRIDAEDIPEVIFATFTGSNYRSGGVLRAVSGQNGARVWPTTAPTYAITPGAEIAVADVDPASPGPEILACSESATTPGHLLLIAANGSLLRRFDTAPNDVACGYDAPAVGDMNGDGVPEIIVRHTIAHADGTVVARVRDDRTAMGVYGLTGTYNTLVSVDSDEDLELVSSLGAWNLDGTAVWDRSTGTTALPVGNIAIADLNLDGNPEMVIIAGGTHSVRVVDARTGADVWGPTDINPPEMATVIAGDGNPNGGGPPTIGNFDADPNPEIAFAGGFAYVVFDHDGSRLWWQETIDRSSRQTGSSLFDFQGDGVSEVLYNDERFFRIYQGTDGVEVFSRCNTSGTIREFPIVVDVDNDDGAEIVLMQNNYAYQCPSGNGAGTGIRVFGDPRREWVRTRRIFNQHTYHVTNINEDGTVPRRETRHWTGERTNNFRLNVQPDGLFNAPDLSLVDLQADARSCPTTLGLSVRVLNRGSAGAPAGVPVTFYLVASDGTRMRIGRSVTTRSILPGESTVVALPSGFAVPQAMQSAEYRFVAVLNESSDEPLATLHECRTDNNESNTTIGVCTGLI